MMFRLSLSVGVSSPLSMLKSVSRMRYLRIDSAFETFLLVSATASSISAIRSGFLISSATVVPAGRLWRSSQPGSAPDRE